MPAYMTSVRRAAILALVAFAAACSSDATGPQGGPPPGNQTPGNGGGNPGPGDPGNPGNGQIVASIELSGDGEIVASYMGWLQAKPKKADGSAADVAVTWSSSDPSTITVDAVGAMKGLEAGSAVITASAGGRRAQYEVRVVPRKATYLETMTNTLPVLHRNDVGYFGVLALDQHRQLIHDAPVVYTSADPSIIEVRGNSLIPIRGGQTTITAAIDGLSKSTTMRVANETTYPLKYANGNALPWVMSELVTPQPEGWVMTRLVVTEGSLTLSNVSDAWSQRLVVEEWKVSDFQGNRIESKVATHVSTSSGTVTVEAATGRLLLATSGSTEDPLQAWFDGARNLRVYGGAENGSALYDYQR